jgi:hypothetical protein
MQEILQTPLSAILFEKLTASQLVKKFIALYITPKLLTALGTTLYYLSQKSPVHAVMSHLLKSILILSSDPCQDIPVPS